MASSQHVAICKAVAALFAQAPALAAGRIEENRDYALATGVASQIHVNLDESRPQNDIVYTGHPIDWATDIEVRIKARAVPGGDSARDVVDAIWQACWQRLYEDTTALGGMSKGIEPGNTSWGDGSAEVGVETLTWYFTVQHRTANNALT